MRTRRGLILLLAAFIGLIVIANSARQRITPFEQWQWSNEEQIGVGQAYSLSETVDDDVLALAETIHVNADGVIHGDAALIGGSIDIYGRVDGDLAVMGERLHVHPGAQISGNAVLLVSEVVLEGRLDGTVDVRGENLAIQPGAQLDAEVFACAGTITDARDDARRVRPCRESPAVDQLRQFEAWGEGEIVLPIGMSLSSPITALVVSLMGSLAFSGLAILAVVVFPRQISHIEEAIQLHAPRLGGIGLLLFLFAIGVTFAVAVVVSIIPPLAIILVPLYLVAALIFLGMMLAGWITITLLCGQLLLRRFNLKLPPLVMVVVGNIALAIVWHVLMLIPFLQPLAGLLVIALVAVGLGATAVTRLGTRPMHRSYLIQA